MSRLKFCNRYAIVHFLFLLLCLYSDCAHVCFCSEDPALKQMVPILIRLSSRRISIVIFKSCIQVNSS